MKYRSLITNSEAFMKAWEKTLKNATKEEVLLYIASTSPQHPSPNMTWLYDRLILWLVSYEMYGLEASRESLTEQEIEIEMRVA